MIITKNQLQLYRACASDKLRPVLNCIHITNKVAEATNGYEMVRIDSSDPDNATEVSFLVSMTDAKDIIKKMGKLERIELIYEPSVSVSDDANTILVKIEGRLDYRIWAQPGNFPTTDVITQALDNPLQARCVLSIEQLTKVLETMKSAGSHEVELSLHFYANQGSDPERWLLTPVCVRSWDHNHTGNHIINSAIMTIIN